ncbi:DUF2092 domain-containing protein [Solibacillus sp. R5-41]|uniref:LolA family protein n=1 Tax=Solibacillus sp. R5-41 TaxID=2048654 RepID=UPI0012FD0A4C|nr:DUF2092 domain-containing protein [Solibacillus sp. R5-41]
MKKLICAGTLAMGLLLGACSEEMSNLSPQEILDQAVQETTTLQTYYGEYVMDIGDGQSSTVKEWVKDGKRRVELQGSDNEHIITVNDGQKIMMLDVDKNIVNQFDFSDESKPFVTPSLKEQATMMLNMIEDTHDIKVAGEEKIAGRDTYHIVATTEEKSLIGDLEVWVDKENWMVLKSITKSADLEMVSEYKVIDLSPTLEDELFVLDIPEGAVVEHQDTDITFEQVELEKVIEKLGTFLIFTDEDLTLETIQDYGSEKRPEFAFNYSKDGSNWLVLSILPKVQVDDEGSLGEEKITVRNIEGEQIEMGNFRLIQWSEDNLTYNVMIENPDTTFEEIYAYIEKMELVQ